MSIIGMFSTFEEICHVLDSDLRIVDSDLRTVDSDLRTVDSDLRTVDLRIVDSKLRIMDLDLDSDMFVTRLDTSLRHAGQLSQLRFFQSQNVL